MGAHCSMWTRAQPASLPRKPWEPEGPCPPDERPLGSLRSSFGTEKERFFRSLTALGSLHADKPTTGCQAFNRGPSAPPWHRPVTPVPGSSPPGLTAALVTTELVTTLLRDALEAKQRLQPPGTALTARHSSLFGSRTPTASSCHQNQSRSNVPLLNHAVRLRYSNKCPIKADFAQAPLSQVFTAYQSIAWPFTNLKQAGNRFQKENCRGKSSPDAAELAGKGGGRAGRRLLGKGSTALSLRTFRRALLGEGQADPQLRCSVLTFLGDPSSLLCPVPGVGRHHRALPREQRQLHTVMPRRLRPAHHQRQLFPLPISRANPHWVLPHCDAFALKFCEALKSPFLSLAHGSSSTSPLGFAEMRARGAAEGEQPLPEEAWHPLL